MLSIPLFTDAVPIALQGSRLICRSLMGGSWNGHCGGKKEDHWAEGEGHLYWGSSKDSVHPAQGLEARLTFQAGVRGLGLIPQWPPVIDWGHFRRGSESQVLKGGRGGRVQAAISTVGNLLCTHNKSQLFLWFCPFAQTICQINLYPCIFLSVAALDQASAFSKWNTAQTLGCLPLRSLQPSLTRAGWSSWSSGVIKSSFCLEPIYSFLYPSYMPLWVGSSCNCSCSSNQRQETLTWAQIPHGNPS